MVTTPRVDPAWPAWQASVISPEAAFCQYFLAFCRKEMQNATTQEAAETRIWARQEWSSLHLLVAYLDSWYHLQGLLADEAELTVQAIRAMWQAEGLLDEANAEYRKEEQ